ncbi:MAG: phenylacetate--CoA ligase [Tissierellia bacterium]|nr:phenylacetate--CoA ligase [Tissierellia bacterium]
MIWAKEEKLSRDEIEQIQLERLKKQVEYAYNRVKPYREKMDKLSVKPSDINSLEDLKYLPFVVKSDFRENYPFGMFAVDRKELKRLHASSGTTGKPTVVGYTQNDMDMWTETVSRIAAMGGATKDDTAQICFGYGMFTGALGLHYGLENIGADIIPSSAGNTEKQVMFMRDFGTTVLVATPSYALHIAEVIQEQGMNPARDFSLKYGILGGESLSDKMRYELNEIWEGKVLFTQNYGMSELNGPGVSGECDKLQGMHICEDHFLAEVINPETEEVLKPGEEGELVITCLTKETLPLIRYRTGDLTSLHYEPCSCGRTTVRMEALKGRSDDMLLIRGVNVFPSQIEEVLLSIDEVGSNYEIIVERIRHMDKMTVVVELTEYDLLSSYSYIEELEKQIRSRIKGITGVDSKVKIAAPRTLKRFEGKAKRVIDLRKS